MANPRTLDHRAPTRTRKDIEATDTHTTHTTLVGTATTRKARRADGTRRTARTARILGATGNTARARVKTRLLPINPEGMTVATLERALEVRAADAGLPRIRPSTNERNRQGGKRRRRRNVGSRRALIGRARSQKVIRSAAIGHLGSTATRVGRSRSKHEARRPMNENWRFSSLRSGSLTSGTPRASLVAALHRHPLSRRPWCRRQEDRPRTRMARRARGTPNGAAGTRRRTRGDPSRPSRARRRRRTRARPLPAQAARRPRTRPDVRGTTNAKKPRRETRMQAEYAASSRSCSPDGGTTIAIFHTQDCREARATVLVLSGWTSNASCVRVSRIVQAGGFVPASSTMNIDGVEFFVAISYRMHAWFGHESSYFAVDRCCPSLGTGKVPPAKMTDGLMRRSSRSMVLRSHGAIVYNRATRRLRGVRGGVSCDQSCDVARRDPQNPRRSERDDPGLP